MTSNTPQKEEMTFIELMSYFGSAIKKGFIALINALSKFIRFIYRNIVILIVTIAIAILIGCALYFFKPGKYKASGTVFVYGTPASTLREIISAIPVEYESNSKKILSGGIKSISSHYYVDILKDGFPDYVLYPKEKLPRDTNYQLMNDRLFIEIKAKNIFKTETLEKELLSYLNSNSLLIKNYNFHKESLAKGIEFCTKEINRIDSLSNKMYFDNSYNDIQLSGGVLSLGRVNTQLFYEDLFKLQEQKNSLLKEFEELDAPVDFPAGIAIDTNSIYTLKRYILNYSLIGLFSGIIIALIWRNRKRIANYLNS